MSEPSEDTPIGTVRGARKLHWRYAVLAFLLFLSVGTPLVLFALELPRQLEKATFLPPVLREARFKNLVGKPKKDVIRRAGTPDQILIPKKTGAPIEVPEQFSYYVPIPTWPARGEVLVYADRIWTRVTYIYLDGQGIVEHIARAGS